MGLRRQIVGYVFALCAGCVLLGIWAIQRGLAQAYEDVELEEAHDDFQHLVAVLDGEIQHRERMLREWRLWPELRRHLMRPDPAFIQRNFSPSYLGQLGLDGLLLLDERGELVLQAWAAVDGASWLASLPAGTRRWLSAPPSEGPACGLAGSPDYLVLLCRRPLEEPGLRDGARGVLVMAERLDSHFLRQLERRVGLPVRFVPAAQALPLAGDQVQPLGSAELPGAGPWSLRRLDERLLMHWPLPVAGEPLQRVALEVQHGRRIAQRGEREARERRLTAGVLALVFSLTLAWLLDRTVISRVVRMRRELAAIREQRRWHAAVTLQGADEINELGAGINHLLSVIDRQVYELEKLSLTDALTGLPNRRCFSQRLGLSLRQQHRSGASLCLILIDVDHFKLYNDHYGHAAGDQALQQVARCLQQVARRPTDLPARLGGEEFALLLQDTDADGALHQAEEFRALLAQAHIAHEAQPGQGDSRPRRITASIGLAMFATPDSPDTLYQRADAALYRAKAAGRDRIECA
ncbi:diguanylate cyclase domain-containing protein [Roseateles sp. DB2]|uniref:GGDEF domain-containing protein n=1 Tax=Roseateles sp. DB2 TaxID=3453717 RepID=UPI003EEB5CC9